MGYPDKPGNDELRWGLSGLCRASWPQTLNPELSPQFFALHYVADEGGVGLALGGGRPGRQGSGALAIGIA